MLPHHQLFRCAPSPFLCLHPTSDPAEGIVNQQRSLSWRVTQGPSGGGRGEDFNGIRDPLMITSSGESFISLLNCQKTSAVKDWSAAFNGSLLPSAGRALHAKAPTSSTGYKVPSSAGLGVQEPGQVSPAALCCGCDRSTFLLLKAPSDLADRRRNGI